MPVIEQSIDVDVPVRLAYRQWVRFEEYPRFLEGVLSVKRVSNGRLLWSARVCGVETNWYAQVTEELPDQRIAWRSEGGLYNDGTVTLTPLDEQRTRVDLRIEYDPEHVLRGIGYKVGPDQDQVRVDLETFKELIEEMAERSAGRP